MKKVSVNTYKKDKYYPRVVRAIAQILFKSNIVAPVGVLIQMGNLSKANRILRIIGFYVHYLNMVPRQTHYRQWGKGKKRTLRFSKSCDKRIEEAYSRHYIWNQSTEKKIKAIGRGLPEQTVQPDRKGLAPFENSEFV